MRATWPHLRRLALAAAALLTAGQLGLLAARPPRLGSQEFRVVEPDRGQASRLLVSSSFTLSYASALAIRLECPDLSNHWLDLTARLVNEQTGRSYEFARTLAQYNGTDERRGYWVADHRRARAVLSAIPSGRYHFNLYPTLDKDTYAVALQLDLEEDTPLWSNYFTLLGVLALLPLATWARRSGFEQVRWAGNAYSPFSTS